jgi:hypothetical protein
MSIIQLEGHGIDYANSALADAGGIARAINTCSLASPIVFAPDSAASANFRDLEAGGVTTQLQADIELGNYLSALKRKDFGLCSVLAHDPWIDIEDLRKLEELPKETINLDNRAYYLHDIRAVTPALIREFRSLCISFLKLIYVSTMSVTKARELLCSDDVNRYATYAASVRFLAVNACDDETWVVVSVLSG